MTLTNTQKRIWRQARTPGSGEQGVGLTESVCAYLVARIAVDLGYVEQLPDLPAQLPDLLDVADPQRLELPRLESKAVALFERLLEIDPNGDSYFQCLAALHKARLKYETILETQAFPTLEQVGPRGLLQFGKLSSKALCALLLWRKWFFDIDNRAGQETGYLFEPVIARAIGGISYSARKSPLKRHRSKRKGRQVDCLLEDEKEAYEFKIRVTIAASGQGRWREELDWPIDCRKSGYTPVLVVLDSTRNEKLEELAEAFTLEKGETYIGERAWEHLETLAGPTMARFLDKYVRAPIKELIQAAPDPLVLPDFNAAVRGQEIVITIGDEVLRIRRRGEAIDNGKADPIPDDVPDDLGE